MRNHRSRRSRRAEIASQIFVYILGILVVGLLLLLGMRVINDLGDKKCDIQAKTFELDLQDTIKARKTRGTSVVESFTLPCGATAVCFVDQTAVDAAIADPTNSVLQADLAGPYKAIARNVLDGDTTNVYVKTESGYEPLDTFTVTAAVTLTNEAIRCIDGDPLTIRFDGKGRTTEPSKQ